MKKNALLFLSLFASLMLVYIFGKLVVFKGILPTLNPVFVEEITKTLTIKTEKIPPTQTPEIVQITKTESDLNDSEPTASRLAKCLSEKGFVMYGTDTCGACAIQRSYFGSYFSHVNYINCDRNPSICENKGISGYPTWEDREGRKYKGAIPLDMLAQLSGC